LGEKWRCNDKKRSGKTDEKRREPKLNTETRILRRRWDGEGGGSRAGDRTRKVFSVPLEKVPKVGTKKNGEKERYDMAGEHLLEKG